MPTPTFEPPPTVNIMRRLGLEPDPWQLEVLEADHPRLLLNCCRQAGKSTVVAILALVHALFRPMTRVLLLSRSHRQSKELLRLMVFYHKLLGAKLLERKTANELEFDQFSRIVSVPCKEETIRGYAHVDFVIIDEAARVPDDLFRAVTPMLAVSQGRMICLSTPYGRRGFFWEAWAKGGDDWARIEIPAGKCPRIPQEFLEREKRSMGESFYRQEYECSFESLEGLVFTDFAKLCVVSELPRDLAILDDRMRRDPSPPAPLPEGEGRLVGGIDFGFRNPFAAVWGFLDRDDVLWLTGEHYARQKPLGYHVQRLPRGVMWYADPSGAQQISELRCAGVTVRQGRNPLMPGIMAITGRLNNGTLKVLEGRCPNLLAEAGLYQYDTERHGGGGEKPVDDHNHALDALRYLISRIDARKMALTAKVDQPMEETPPKPKEPIYYMGRTFREFVEDDSLWTPIG